MKPIVLLAIVLIAAGVAGLVYGNITYTTQQTVVQVGPLQLTAKQNKTLPIPAVAGVVLVAGGVMLLIWVPGVRRSG
jgi:hypothetical protein